MARRFFLLLALITPAILLSDAAHACSCIESSTTSKQARDRKEREWMQEVWKFADTIVLVRTLATRPGKEVDSEHATLLVVRAWKGPYKEGDHIESYTEGIGGGMCDSSVPDLNPFLLYFHGAAANINGCPSSFVVTPVRSSELDRLKRKDAKAKKK